MPSNPDRDMLAIRQASKEAMKLLREASRRLDETLQNHALKAATPPGAASTMKAAAEFIDKALRQIDATQPTAAASIPGGPTRQQGQFLAFIRDYMMRNSQGVAPTHAELQRFFDLTAPSVNSMLVRLEQRGFIRRVPGQARAIELIIQPDWIPALERRFKI